jgi:DNA-binding response OmpR family regulator
MSPALKSCSASPTILIADDEPVILTILVRELKGSGFTVLTATSGRQAIDLLQAHHETIAVALIDLNLPDLDGLTTAEALLHIKPTLLWCLASGDLVTQEDVLLPGLAAILGKPFVLSEVGALMRKLHQQLADTQAAGGLQGACPAGPIRGRPG